MPSNTAAWLTAAQATPLIVKEAPYTPPSENQILIKNGAVAINPVDWALQDMGDALFPWIHYPTILGTDVAGEVVEVGSGASRFKPGDRVVGMVMGSNPKHQVSAERGFQAYSILQSNMAALIPATLSYESACVLPMGVSVAAYGLFRKDMLALEYPTTSPKPQGRTVLIWGGSTSMGCNAIQLAVSAGYEVISTSSPKNFDLVKKLGASQVFDYSSPTVITDLVEAFKGKVCAGAVAIGNVATMFSGVAEACVEVVSKVEGTKFVALTMPVPKDLPAGAEAKFILVGEMKDDELGNVIYRDFLPKALAEGHYVAAPEPLVVGKGLGCLQEALDVQKKGVSARKVVVSLQ